MMKNGLKTEWRKMIHSRTLWVAVLIGTVLCIVNFIENIQLLNWFTSVSKAGTYGYSTLSIFGNWIDGASDGIGELVFFIIFPILAALPFAWSFCSERRDGYTDHLLTRESKRSYLVSKYVVVFASGGIAIVLPLILNFILNAWILPICSPAPLIVGGGDAMYLSRLLFTKPMIYLIGVLFTAFCWGGLIACLGTTVSSFIHNTIVALLSPFVIFYGETVLVDAFVRTSGHNVQELMYMLSAMPGDPAPTWYVWTILLGLLAVVTIVYFLRGKHDEMLS
ncbi:MAG: hypothetical protein LUC41_06480 [Clostridiales bacterium]|nr:hypothetical protein [Clostridiales bacterium]